MFVWFAACLCVCVVSVCWFCFHLPRHWFQLKNPRNSEKKMYKTHFKLFPFVVICRFILSLLFSFSFLLFFLSFGFVSFPASITITSIWSDCPHSIKSSLRLIFVWLCTLTVVIRSLSLFMFVRIFIHLWLKKYLLYLKYTLVFIYESVHSFALYFLKWNSLCFLPISTWPSCWFFPCCVIFYFEVKWSRCCACMHTFVVMHISNYFLRSISVLYTNKIEEFYGIYNEILQTLISCFLFVVFLLIMLFFTLFVIAFSVLRKGFLWLIVGYFSLFSFTFFSLFFLFLPVIFVSLLLVIAEVNYERNKIGVFLNLFIRCCKPINRSGLKLECTETDLASLRFLDAQYNLSIDWI